ncbi:sugar phosphate isomerase/epimerase [Planctomycetales bacterium ZRK34]|nr:sugar phosphate isomerase/epimerase [Planctomycetales bacterium ZRK34]
MNRRDFLRQSSLLVAGLGLAGCATMKASAADKELFKISLAQWSFNKRLFKKKQPHMDNLDFPAETRKLGIEAVEYVNQFFADKAKDKKYLAELKKRCDSEGVYSNLIMCDRLGNLGEPDAAKRKQAVENHHPWVDAAKFLGCQHIRVNARSSGSYEEQQKLAADGLAMLCEYGDKQGINVIVENHGGLSSNGAWLAGVMKMVDNPRVGTLPDFGNFRIAKDEMYDRYKGVDEMMPYAKAVSAKTHDFDAEGNETHTDYMKMMDIVVNKHGYHGYVGIEFEGGGMSAEQGILATKKLLERCRAKLSA